MARDRGIGTDPVNGNVQNSEPPTMGPLVMQSRVISEHWAWLRQGWEPACPSPVCGPCAYAHRALLSVEPLDGVDTGWLPLPPEQDEQATVSKPPAFIPQLSELGMEACPGSQWLARKL